MFALFLLPRNDALQQEDPPVSATRPDHHSAICVPPRESTVKLSCPFRLALSASLLILVAQVSAENWPQWRGPENKGVSTEEGLPTRWSDTENVAWKSKLPGRGSSTPAVWANRLFLTCQEDTQVVALCISTAGKELWKRSLGPASRLGQARGPGRGDEGGVASSSPSTDGKYVYFFAGNGEFAAFDFSGKEIWRFDAQRRYGEFVIQFGMHTTPVLFGDRLYLQLIHSGGAWVIAIDKTTGKDVWKVERPSDGTDENEHSYASAFIWKKGSNAYLVVHGNDYTTAHSLLDGKELWRVGDLNPRDPRIGRYNRTLRFVASPVCTPDLIVIPSAKRGPVVGLRPDASGKVMAGSKYMQWRISKNTPDVPSPLVYDGLVYLGRENGELLVLDAMTGKQLYYAPTHNHIHRASPVYADGKIYLTARDGVISVVQAGREFKLLATSQLPDKTAASPAISGGRIYIRGYQYLWAIEQKK
jgi:outer membrane protein assembly factor BamB